MERVRISLQYLLRYWTVAGVIMLSVYGQQSSESPIQAAPSSSPASSSTTANDVLRTVAGQVTSLQYGQAFRSLSPLNTELRTKIGQERAAGLPLQGAVARVKSADDVLRSLEVARTAYATNNLEQAYVEIAASGFALLRLERTKDPQTRLEQAKQDLVRNPRNAVALDRVAFAALQASRTREAYDYARQAFEAAKQAPTSPMLPDLLGRSHTIMGVAALALGNLEEAKQHLMASAQEGNGQRVRLMGPSMMLARMLLAQGQTEAVRQFLELCAQMEWPNRDEKLSVWRSAIQQGSLPDFGPQGNLP